MSKLLSADCSLDPTVRVSALKAECRELVAPPLDYRGGLASETEAEESEQGSGTDLEAECLPFALPPPPPPPPPSAPPQELAGEPVAVPMADGATWSQLGDVPTPTGEFDVVADLVKASEFDLSVALAEAPSRPAHGWVVSKSRSARKLHFVGMCFRVPGKHFLEFDTFGDVMPDETEIDSRCKDCFSALGPAGVPVADSDEEASTVSSSSSSSSEDDAPPVKARRR